MSIKHSFLFPIIGLLALFVVVGCGGEKTKETVIVQSEPAPNPNPNPDPDPDPPGCENGKVTAFVDIQPILTRTCANCHSGYDSFGVASDRGKYAEFLNRINLPANNNKRMPKIPNPELSVQEKRLLQEFADDGYNREKVCRGGGGGVFGLMDLHDLEKVFNADLDSLNSAVGERNSRWLAVTHKKNAGASARSMETYKKGVDKSVNMLSDDRDILLTSYSDSEKTLFRIDLDALGLTADDWALVVANDGFQFVSQTRRGRIIRDRTGSDVPWIHADNFINIALGDPVVYNQLRRIPLKLADLLRELEVDVNGGFSGDFDARLIGGNGSRIGEQNRLILRLEQDSTNGGYWQSFDVDNNFVAEKNLFEFPLLVVGTNKFLFDASEVIYELENNLQGFALYNGAGIRQVAAPINIVQDKDNPFDAEIENGLDCARCHNKGMIPFNDQIRDHVQRNASEFLTADVEFVRALYKSNDTNQALINTQNNRFQSALRKLNISPNEPDPVNEFVDAHKRVWTLSDAAGFVVTMGTKQAGINAEDYFCQGLNDARRILGGLCSSTIGIVTLDQMKEAFPDLINDFRLGLDPIDQ